MSLFTFTPAEAKFLSKVIGRTRNNVIGFTRLEEDQHILDEIQQRLHHPIDLEQFPLDSRQQSCLVDALHVFTTLEDPKFSESTVSQEDRRQAWNLIERLRDKADLV
jgi:hypothetical protein